MINTDKRHGSNGVLVTDTHYTGGDRLLVEYKEGALQRCGSTFLSSSFLPPSCFRSIRAPLQPRLTSSLFAFCVVVVVCVCVAGNQQTTRSRRMAADYEISMMSFSGLPYRTHTLRY